MSEIKCEKCGTAVAEENLVDPSIIQKVRESTGDASVPDKLCFNCYGQISGSKGGVLFAQEKAKEQKKVMMWKGRVSLIKKARNYMIEKRFSDAAVSYEKYLRVLEVVFDVKKGELTPELFKDSARTQELTIVASTYWDLLRIYDTSDKYGSRQADAAKKLAVFLRYTPIFPDVIRKAEIFQKNARNPGVIKNFIKLAGEEKGRCFIATAAFGSYLEPEVIALSRFRDQTLAKHALGRAFIAVYYFVSPPLARILDHSPKLKFFIRLFLRRIISWVAPQ